MSCARSEGTCRLRTRRCLETTNFNEPLVLLFFFLIFYLFFFVVLFFWKSSCKSDKCSSPRRIVECITFRQFIYFFLHLFYFLSHAITFCGSLSLGFSSFFFIIFGTAVHANSSNARAWGCYRNYIRSCIAGVSIWVFVFKKYMYIVTNVYPFDCCNIYIFLFYFYF